MKRDLYKVYFRETVVVMTNIIQYEYINCKRSIASTFYPPRSSAIIVSHYTQSKKFST